MAEEAVQPQDEKVEAEVPAKTEAEEVKPEAEVEKEPEKRQIFSMPVAKAQEEKRRAVERAKKEAEDAAEERISKLKEDYETRLRVHEPDSKLREVAEKHGLDPEAARELADVIRQGVKVPDVSKYEQFLKEREIEGHKQAVSSDFDSKVQPLILKDNPHATPEFIRSVKAKVEELAFTEGYNTYRIEDIYRVKRDEFTFKNGMGAEAPKGHGTDIQPFKRLSDEDEIKLSKTDFEAYKRYIGWLRGQESKYMD